MKFETAAGQNPIDKLNVVGKPIDRVEGPLKVTGTATYAYEQHAAAPNAATIQRIRIGASRDGRITAIGHESWSGNLAGGRPEAATAPTRLLCAGPHRMTRLRLAHTSLKWRSMRRRRKSASGACSLCVQPAASSTPKPRAAR
jgi:CO/xanthine dehydrogenase Mo-binding subunit